MQRALELADRGRYSVSPNPMVGAVLVRDGKVIGEGYHHRAGEPHAEIEALRDADASPAGATLYVTLEPCSHHGRTPPCTTALIEAGISTVVLAVEDPSAHAAGKGIEELMRAGIEVVKDVCLIDAERQNEIFLHSAAHLTPFVLLKAGMSLDGKLATTAGESQWITSPESRERSLVLREEYDAILVGSGTVVHDDPRLTRRLGLSSSIQPWLRIVVDGGGNLPSGATVLTDGGETIVYTPHPERYRALGRTEAVEMAARDDALDLKLVLHDLRERGVRSLIVEGGAKVWTSMIRERLWQKMQLFIAPMIVGGAEAPSIFKGDVQHLNEAPRFRFDSFETIGPDLLVTAYPD